MIKKETIKRYESFYAKLNKPTLLYKNILWTEYQKMIVPVGPVKFDYVITKEDFKNIALFFPKSLLIRTTNNLNITEKKDWYVVVCNDFKNKFNRQTELRIEKGLKNCNAKIIDPLFIARNGYQLYLKAHKRYNSRKILNEKSFSKEIIIAKDYDDIINYWGVFYKNKLVGYSIRKLYDNIEARYFETLFDSDYFKFFSSYVAWYAMNNYYLNDRKFEYVNDGFKSLLHKTEIQDYLIRNFNFEKRYLDLNIFYKPATSLLLSTTFAFRRLIGRFDLRAEALYKQEEIRRNIKND
jgi:hypothetical protein